MQRQHIDIKKLYVSNVKGTFFGGYSTHRSEFSWPEGFAFLLHTLLLPVSLTAGAGLKTLVDVVTRHEISEEDIQKLKTTIQHMDGEDFDKFILVIMKSDEPKSQSSKTFWRALCDINYHESDRVYSFKESEKNKIFSAQREAQMSRIKEFKTAHAKEINDLRDSIDIYTKSSTKQLSDDDIKQIDQKVNAFKLDLAKEKRNSQRKLIIDYLDNIKNAGKKTEHVIMRLANQYDPRNNVIEMVPLKSPHNSN